jgi:hypothetical protein
MTGQSVCAAEWDDAQDGSGFAGFRDESLDDLMDGAISPAGKDDLSPLRTASRA